MFDRLASDWANHNRIRPNADPKVMDPAGEKRQTPAWSRVDAPKRSSPFFPFRHMSRNAMRTLRISTLPMPRSRFMQRSTRPAKSEAIAQGFGRVRV